MTEDPLTQLREQLIEAGDRRAEERAAEARGRHRVGRRSVWLTLAVLVIAVPAGATATGVINFGTSGSTPDGSTYTTARISDEQAATDPQQRDGVGRTCDTTEVRDRAGKLVSKGMACRPRNTPPSQDVIGAGFSVVPGDALLIRGTVAPQVAKVTISGYNQPVDLKPEPHGGRLSFSEVVVPVGDHDVVATGDDGQELGRTTVSPGPRGR